MADACIISTQDHGHFGPALAALAKGYHVLLEKPMAPTEEECRRLVRASRDSGSELRVCHVLRYTSFFSAMKREIASGAIGDVVSLQHSENLGYWHFAHSYVRGNWRRRDESNPLILAKACHDMDIMYWLAGSRARSINSFGSLGFYTRSNAPAGTPSRCTEGCPIADACPWYAPRLYLHGTPMIDSFRHSPSALVRLAARVATSAALRERIDWREWPSATISDDHSAAARLEALRSGPYGRCVFHCDNDVVDRQTVDVAFENGAVGSFALHGFSHEEGRRIRIDGTRGTLEGSFGLAGSLLLRHDHRSGRSKILIRNADLSGHGGGDSGVMEAFVETVEARMKGSTPSDHLADAGAALESHLMCFAAERSRLEGESCSIERG
jgi:predicted dehydrogenase